MGLEKMENLSLLIKLCLTFLLQGNPGTPKEPELIVTSSSSISVRMKMPSDEAVEVRGELKCFQTRYMINGTNPNMATLHQTCVPPSQLELKLEGLKSFTTYDSEYS